MLTSITPQEQNIAEILSLPLNNRGYEIIRVKFIDGKRRTLQIMIERLDNAPIAIEDCEAASRAASAILDVEDPLQGSYNLEVSSPGIDRPLVRIKDFIRYLGYEIKLTANQEINGRKNFKGRITEANDSYITLKAITDNEAIKIEYHQIHQAKLVLNDELLEIANNQSELKN